LRHANEHDFDPALAVLDTILTLDPSYIPVLSDKALSLSKSGRSNEADAAFQDLMRREVWDTSFVNNYALHLLGTGRTKEGLAMLEKAIGIDGNIDSLENLGAYHHYIKNDSERASHYFNRVLDSDPERTKALVLKELIKLKAYRGQD